MIVNFEEKFGKGRKLLKSYDIGSGNPTIRMLYDILCNDLGIITSIDKVEISKGGVIKIFDKKIKDFKIVNNEITFLVKNFSYKSDDELIEEIKNSNNNNNNLKLDNSTEDNEFVKIIIASEYLPEQLFNESEGLLNMKDDRVRIPVQSGFPYNLICQINTRFGENRIIRGTGFFITPDKIITAAHCLFDHDKKLGWANTINIYFNSRHIKISNFYCMKSFMNSNKSEHDFGILCVEENFDLKEFFILKELKNNDSDDYFVTGFLTKNNHCYYKNGKILENNELIKHNIQTTDGQSGSPIYRGNECYGVHVMDGNYCFKFKEHFLNNMYGYILSKN